MARIEYDPPTQKPILDPSETYYSTRETAQLLHLSMSSLADYRRRGVGPKFIMVGYRTCLYAKTEVLRFVEERTRTSTSATQNYDLYP